MWQQLRGDVRAIDRCGQTNRYMIKFNSKYALQKWTDAWPWFPAVYFDKSEEKKWAEEEIERLGFQVIMRNYEECWAEIEVVNAQKGLE